MEVMCILISIHSSSIHIHGWIIDFFCEQKETLRKKREEEEAMWTEYIEQRKKQRSKEEEDLKKLKERQVRVCFKQWKNNGCEMTAFKQIKRKAQRAEQEHQMLEMKRKQEEQKLREIEDKKAKEAEAKRKRLEEAEKKRQAMLEAMQTQSNAGVKPNFVINRKEGGASLSLGRSELIKTKEQLAEEKKIALGLRLKPLDIEGLSVGELKKKASELWEQIVTLESDIYDLEERQKRQDYDVSGIRKWKCEMHVRKLLTTTKKRKTIFKKILTKYRFWLNSWKSWPNVSAKSIVTRRWRRGWIRKRLPDAFHPRSTLLPNTNVVSIVVPLTTRKCYSKEYVFSVHD